MFGNDEIEESTAVQSTFSTTNLPTEETLLSTTNSETPSETTTGSMSTQQNDASQVNGSVSLLSHYSFSFFCKMFDGNWFNSYYHYYSFYLVVTSYGDRRSDCQIRRLC